LVFLNLIQLGSIWRWVKRFYFVYPLSCEHIEFFHQVFLQSFIVNENLVLDWLIRLKQSFQILMLKIREKEFENVFKFLICYISVILFINLSDRFPHKTKLSLILWNDVNQLFHSYEVKSHLWSVLDACVSTRVIELVIFFIW